MIETVQIVAITRRLNVLSIAVYVYKTAAREIYTIRQAEVFGKYFLPFRKKCEGGPSNTELNRRGLTGFRFLKYLIYFILCLINLSHTAPL